MGTATVLGNGDDDFYYSYRIAKRAETGAFGPLGGVSARADKIRTLPINRRPRSARNRGNNKNNNNNKY
jgi:hypothetical protein